MGLASHCSSKTREQTFFYLFQTVMPPSNKNIAPKSFECFMERPSPFRFIYYIQDSILFSTNTEYSFPGLDLKLSNKALVTNPWEFYPPHSNVQLFSPPNASCCQLGSSLFWESILYHFWPGITAPLLLSLHKIGVIWKTHEQLTVWACSQGTPLFLSGRRCECWRAPFLPELVR